MKVFFIGLFFGCIGLLAAETAQLPDWLTPIIGLKVQEAYDDDIYDQDHGPLADKSSWITSVQPRVGAKLSCPAATVQLSYEPDYSFYHSADKESYLRHIFVGRLSGQYETLRYSGGVRLAYTEGTTDEITWPLGSAPVLVATEVRDRRRNLKHDWDLNIRWDGEDVFVRLIGEAHFWDFKARQRLGIPGYHNHVDRSTSDIGFDIGCKPDWPVEFYLGYRAGAQGQSHYPGSDLLYDNIFHRVLAGMNGQPTQWLKIDGVIGPSFHFFDEDTIHPGQDDERTLLYFRVAATADLKGGIQVQAGGRQFLLPSSAGRIAYQNLKWWGSVSVPVIERIRATIGFTVAEFDFLPPVAIRDRTYSPTVAVNWAINEHLSAGAQYAFTWGEALAKDQDLREFEKHQVFLSLTYSY